MAKREHWKSEPDDHDYPAASDYLSLSLAPDLAGQVVAALRIEPIVHRKAKDLLRASGLPVLGTDNPHVARDLKKVDDGQKLSPVLVVRGDLLHGRPLVIADGYHRVCASHHLDEDADIPCRITDLPAPTVAPADR